MTRTACMLSSSSRQLAMMPHFPHMAEKSYALKSQVAATSMREHTSALSGHYYAWSTT